MKEASLINWIFPSWRCKVDYFYFPVSELWGGDGKAVPWSLRRGQSTCSQFPAKWVCSPLHGGWPVWPGHGAMVTSSSPGHMGSYAVASTDLGMGEEIALQPFNKSCPSLEYINFSLYRRCRVTCHENPLKTFSLLWETNWKCILCCVSDQGTAKNV